MYTYINIFSHPIASYVNSHTLHPCVQERFVSGDASCRVVVGTLAFGLGKTHIHTHTHTHMHTHTHTYTHTQTCRVVVGKQTLAFGLGPKTHTHTHR